VIGQHRSPVCFYGRRKERESIMVGWRRHGLAACDGPTAGQYDTLISALLSGVCTGPRPRFPCPRGLAPGPDRRRCRHAGGGCRGWM